VLVKSLQATAEGLPLADLLEVTDEGNFASHFQNLLALVHSRFALLVYWIH
jgi:hypothetical protein